MTQTKVTIETQDGRADAYLYRPSASPGPWPAVLLFMDGIGIRKALFEIAERVSARGYVVLMPDLFYRAGPYTAVDPKKLFADAEVRSAWFAKFGAAASAAKVRADMPAFLSFLAARSDVAGPRIA